MLIKVMRTHSAKVYKRAHCNKRFAAGSSLLQHYIALHRKAVHKCKHCGKCFNRSSSLKGHLTIHSVKKAYKCSHCEQHFDFRSALLQHYMATHRKTAYKCRHCDKCFKRYSMFKKQKCKRMKKIFTCCVCGEFCHSACGLLNHMSKYIEQNIAELYSGC